MDANPMPPAMTIPTTPSDTPESVAALTEPGFYQKPDHGWTCFHCGETFTTIGTARDHFGFDPSAEPGCRIKLGAERGLLMALRKAEKECADAWFAIHNETTDAAKAYYAASAEVACWGPAKVAAFREHYGAKVDAQAAAKGEG